METGRPRRRWEDCVGGYLIGVGGECRMRARGEGRGVRGDGDSSETRSVTKKEGNKNRRPISVPASPGLQE